MELHVFRIERKKLEFYIKQENLYKTRPNRDIFRHTEAKRIHHQHAGTTINVKESLSRGQEMISDRNLGLQKK